MNGINWKKRNKWGNYQFFHRMEHKQGVIPRFTAAVEIPSKKQLIKMAQALVETKVKTVKLKVGVAAVNPKDKYSKKIGREVSYNRLEKYEFEIRSALAMNHIQQMTPPFIDIENKSFTNIELRAIAKGKIIEVYFTINKLNKVVLGNVIINAWPDYSWDGYRVRPKLSAEEKMMLKLVEEDNKLKEQENAV